MQTFVPVWILNGLSLTLPIAMVATMSLMLLASFVVVSASNDQIALAHSSCRCMEDENTTCRLYDGVALAFGLCFVGVGIRNRMSKSRQAPRRCPA